MQELIKTAPALDIYRYSDFSSANCHRSKLPYLPLGRTPEVAL